MVWLCKARRQSRENHTPVQKRDDEKSNINQQEKQQRTEDQNPALSQGKHQKLHFLNSSQQNQAERQNRQKLWNRCLRKRQQIHQYQREVQHERLQKQEKHPQQQVHFEPFHQQLTDEMQKLQDKIKQEKLLQERRQRFKDQVQEQLWTEQSHNEEECPIPPEYQKTQNLLAQQPVHSQYQPQQLPNRTQNPQTPSQYWQKQAHYRKQPPHVRHHPQPPHVYYPMPQYQVWHSPHDQPWHHPFPPWQPQPQGILWMLQAQYKHLGQQIQDLRWQQCVRSQSEKQQCEMQNQTRFQTWQQPTSPLPTEWQEAHYDARRERHQLQPQKGKQQSRAHDESDILDFPHSPFVTDEHSYDSEEQCSEGEYEFRDEINESDSDLESQSQGSLEGEDENEDSSEECNESENESEGTADENEDKEEDNLESESDYVII